MGVRFPLPAPIKTVSGDIDRNHKSGSAMRIDAHHHLWSYSNEEYDWIDESMLILQRDFLTADLIELADDAAIDATVAVQARQSLVETKWLLDLAASQSRIAGVVGWAPIADPGFPDILAALHDEPKLVGLRHVVQGEPAGFLLRNDFNRGIGSLLETGLSYDILILERQLEEAAMFVDRHPDQRFVLDHCAKPRIAARELEPWRANIKKLALRPNVWCKLSGLVTEADWKMWSLDSLRPYMDTVLEAFGPHRIMAGSDWPVCLLATSYAAWWFALHEYASDLSDAERDVIFGGTAQSFYKLG